MRLHGFTKTSEDHAHLNPQRRIMVQSSLSTDLRAILVPNLGVWVESVTLPLPTSGW